MLEVFGGYAVEAPYPGFQAAVVGIDVLDVEDECRARLSLTDREYWRGDGRARSRQFLTRLRLIFWSSA